MDSSLICDFFFFNNWYSWTFIVQEKAGVPNFGRVFPVQRALFSFILVMAGVNVIASAKIRQASLLLLFLR